MMLDVTTNTMTKQAVCLVENKSIKRKLRRALRGTGIHWTESAEDINPSSIIFIDTKENLHKIANYDQAHESGQVVILGESIADDEVLALMEKATLNHVISAGSEYDEGELLATSVKLTSGDIFGLEKYLRWGAKIHDKRVKSYEEKRGAIDFVGEMGKTLGIRRGLLNRIENVTDELLMNAIYDAPKMANESNPSLDANIRVASDGCFFAVAVTDHYGLLEKKIILNHLSRAKQTGGKPRTTGDSGAGLGLYFVISSCSRFVANIEKGKRTEIICLFDLRLHPRDIPNCANSLHIFIKQ